MITREDGIVWIFCLLLILTAGGLLCFYKQAKPQPQVTISQPGPDYSAQKKEEAAVQIGSLFSFFPDSQSISSSSVWPGFRGTDRDNVVKVCPPLSENWGDNGPPVLWRIPLGEGYAAPVIADGRFYLLDYSDSENGDQLRCFRLSDAKELWRRGYPMPMRRNHGKSRTVPAVENGCVVSLGPKGHVMAVDAVSGALLWSRDPVREDGTEIPQWYAGQCPLIDSGTAVIAPAGPETLLIGIELRTGKTLWKTPNPDSFKMSHASVIPMEIDGRRIYAVCALGGMAGVSAELNTLGQILWRCTDWKPAVWAPSPVALDRHRIFVTAGYGAGAAVIEVKEGKARVTQQWKPKEGPASEQQTPLVWQNYLWTLLPKDAGPNRSQLTGSPLDNPKKWEVLSGRDLRFGLGPYLVADNKFFILDDDGFLSMLKYENHAIQRLGYARVLPGHDAWGPLAFADGILLVRDLNSLAAVDLRQPRESAP